MKISTELATIVKGFGNPRILVVGDLMLDRYVRGKSTKLNQEAPVPVLAVDSVEFRPGGAANVAEMLRALGANVYACGVVGSDRAGDMLKRLDRDHQGHGQFVIEIPGRRTTVKTRYVCGNHHLLRVDDEETTPLTAQHEAEIFEKIAYAIGNFQAVCVSDYAKGFCTPDLLQQIAKLCKDQRIPAIVDPCLSDDYSKYHGFTALTPNRKECAHALGKRTLELAEMSWAAGELRRQLDLEAAAVTIDKDGIWLSSGATCQQFPVTDPNCDVVDVAGAGDSVLAMVGMALACHCDLPNAIRLGNIIGGIEIMRSGVVPITKAEILETLEPKRPSSKFLDYEQLDAFVAAQRAASRSIAFTNGCFDLALHPGHMESLAEAADQADILIVGINSDESVNLLKGSGRPVCPLIQRLRSLTMLECVDAVVVLDGNTPMTLVERIRPDVLAKGGDYASTEIVGAEFVRGYGGRVHITALVPGISTTKLLTPTPGT